MKEKEGWMQGRVKEEGQKVTREGMEKRGRRRDGEERKEKENMSLKKKKALAFSCTTSLTKD